MAKTPSRILAVKLADLGDALLVVPALRALKTAYPGACLDVLTTGAGQAGLENLPYIDRLLVFDKYQFDSPRAVLSPRKLAQAAAFLAGLRLKSYDVVIFFHHFTLRFGALKFRGLAYASGAPCRVGLHDGTIFSSFINMPVADQGFGGEGLTERDYWRQLVEALLERQPGQPFAYDERPEIAISSGETARADAILKEVKGQNPAQPVMAFGPGGGGYSLTRRWPAVNYARLADKLVQNYGAKIALLGTKDEIPLAEQIRDMSAHPASIEILAGRTNPKEAVAFLQNCRLFVGNDGGLAQLAGVAGLPAIVIFGPTNAVAWTPFGATPHGPVKIVQAGLDLPCRPCLYRDHHLGSRLGCAPRPCLTAITPRQVLETIESLKLSE
jgi:heptosyltransferase-2